MIRRIIQIDEEKCNGCGLCVGACHEGAITLVNGKARLLRDEYCDGLGDCLPACPADAISFVEREALPYDENAVLENMKQKTGEGGCSCLGSAPRHFAGTMPQAGKGADSEASAAPSCLGQWPVQIKLVTPLASFLANADVLIAADCTAFAYGNFHADFMRGKVTLIGCPKLDAIDYSEKLTAILQQNDIRSLTVTRMNVPCCAGIASAAATAVKNSGKDIPLEIVTITTEGKIGGPF